MTNTERMDILLHEAAKAYLDGRDPFSTAFLVTHQITNTECGDLADKIAEAILGWSTINRYAAAMSERR